MSEPDKKGEKAKKEWHPGDAQRFIMGLLFLLPFDVLIIIIAVRIWFLDITISVDSFDLQILLTILLTALVGIVNSAAAFYFTSKATEKARTPG